MFFSLCVPRNLIHNSRHSGYVIEKRDLDHGGGWVPAVSWVDPKNTHATVPRLLEGTTYEFRVMAENMQGRGEPLTSDKPVTAKASAGETHFRAKFILRLLTCCKHDDIINSALNRMRVWINQLKNPSTLVLSSPPCTPDPFFLLAIPQTFPAVPDAPTAWTPTRTSSRSTGLLRAPPAAPPSPATTSSAAASTPAAGRRSAATTCAGRSSSTRRSTRASSTSTASSPTTRWERPCPPSPRTPSPPSPCAVRGSSSGRAFVYL